MSIIIDIILIAIIAFAGWRGYKEGIINGVFGLLAVIVAIYLANLVATVYHPEFTGMLKLFANGVIDSSVSSVLHPTPKELQEGIITIEEKDKGDVYVVSYTAMRNIGFSDSLSKQLAEETMKTEKHVGRDLSNTLTELLCQKVSFILIFFIFFVLAAIIFAIIGNIINLKFTLPGLDKVNNIVGAVLGAAKGFMFILVFTCILRYAGMILPEKLITGTVLTEGLINKNLLANLLGI